MRGYGRRWQRCHRPKSHEHETRRMLAVLKHSFCHIQQPGSRPLSVHSESVNSERLAMRKRSRNASAIGRAFSRSSGGGRDALRAFE
jgi:hypothetical protein